MGFKGGKGMACFMGMCLGINPEIGFYCILFVIITTIIHSLVREEVHRHFPQEIVLLTVT